MNLIATTSEGNKSFPEKTIQNFKNYKGPENYSLTNATSELTNEGLKITIEPNVEGVFTLKGNWDLSEWIYLTMELKNLRAETVRFDPIITGELKSRKGKPLWTIGWVKPNETRSFNCLLLPDYSTRKTVYQSIDKVFPNMRGMPEGVSFTNSFDLTLTNQIQIKFPASINKREILLVSLVPKRPAISENFKSDPDKFFPFIDKYGQYKYANWPGKILSDKQLKNDYIEEQKDLNNNKSSAEWNQYGGYKNGPKYKATGHFRTEKIDGKWWIIDPSGCLFWSAGINSACKLNVLTPYVGREHFFDFLPEKNDPVYGKFYKNEEFDFGQATLLKKYGVVDNEKYAEYGLKRMRSWGFNTLGGWGYENVSDFSVDKRIPYTVSVNSVRPQLTDKFPDVFDPRWEKSLRAIFKTKAEKVNKDPYFIGYFVDNEMHWFDPNGMASYVIKNNAASIGKQYYIDLLKNNLKDISIFNEKSGTSFNDWIELLSSTRKIDMNKFESINIQFYNEMTGIYFRTIRNLIDELSPGNLFIGCRWHVSANHRNKYNVTIGAKYLDIISFNQYANEITNETFEEMEKIDRPFLISEFNFGALDRGKFYPGLNYGGDQRNRGEKYKNFIESALRSSKCVGAHWFMWANSTTAGRSVVGENANCGIVSEMDQPYYEMINYMREINYNLYDYRSKIK